ncbi:MAG: phosphate ABC transporter ATP-binding protein PstB [Meiothermus sp.]|uniref:phosphate ABC transporter ATP-binding protein PstB n=1 Tax=Meiothermus sp. TaxID=1955249 RepID=UPI0025DC5DA6|nr:phosphate ABC transporter ATP-binding protein PstB [Meiothermus sp.]MCS7194228.1 phosphate ABC transporter ATP-binding protein PstB [Meiothermus sp.]
MSEFTPAANPQTGHTEIITPDPNAKTRIEARRVTVWYGQKAGVRDVDMPIYANKVTALIGPSGCGKTTFLRALNRMHDLTPHARVTGEVLLDGVNVYDPGVDPVEVRRKIGMVFQKPNPFPTLSIYGNVVAGLRLVGIRKKSLLDEAVERALTQAALWDEVKDRLHAPSMSLSGGQQQRLCIARALAVEPEVLLMDEPTSALDPISTQSIEDLLTELKKHVTIVIVTHNMQQAGRVSDYTGFFLNGDLVEFGPTNPLFTTPKDKRTEAYITGRFG